MILHMTHVDHHLDRGFIVIYRWSVESRYVEEFKQRWHQATMELRALGSLGSCLSQDMNGDFVAIALLATPQARADAFEKMKARPAWNGVTRIEEIQLEVADDLWVNSPFRVGAGPLKAD
jgi:hypothetical protein